MKYKVIYSTVFFNLLEHIGQGGEPETLFFSSIWPTEYQQAYPGTGNLRMEDSSFSQISIWLNCIT